MLDKINKEETRQLAEVLLWYQTNIVEIAAKYKDEKKRIETWHNEARRIVKRQIAGNPGPLMVEVNPMTNDGSLWITPRH
jgi:hypothetical protein